MFTLKDVSSDLKVVLPSSYEELADQPYLREILHRQVDMQFADLATLLRLPLPALGLEAGVNLTTTTLLCNIISGASVLFFEASIDSVRGRLTSANQIRPGERFRRVLDFLPWDEPTTVARREAIDALYRYARNPLAHSLGVGKAPSNVPGLRGRDVVLAKRPLPPEAVADLMRGERERPSWSGMPLITQEGRGYVISVEALAWGVCRMLRTLFASADQVTAAEATAKQLLIGPATVT